MSRIRSLARRGDHVDEAQQVLTGVTEAHAQAQQQGLGCAGGQRQRELHGAYRCPAVSHAAGAGTVFTAWGMDGAPYTPTKASRLVSKPS